MEIFNPYFYAADINLFAYEHAWTQYQQNGEKNFNVLSKDIYDSWDRCKKAGLDPRSGEPPRRISDNALQQHLRQSQILLDIANPYMTDLLEIIDNPEFSVLLSDPSRIILQSLSGNTEQIQPDASSVQPGTDFNELVLGTNSIDLVNRLKTPVQLTYCQHYRSILHRESCSSAPICDTEGRILGVLSVIGRYEDVNEHTLGMVFAVAKAIEKQIGIFHINNKLQQSDQLNTILSMIPNGIVYIEDSRIIHINQAMLHMIGKEQHECIGKPVQDILHMELSSASVTESPSRIKNKNVLLHGSRHVFRCLVSREEIQTTENKTYGQVLQFVKNENIQKMAKEIESAARYTFRDIIGNSDKIRSALELAKKASRFDSRVIIHGESGTGKEMIAQAIHNSSNRSGGPFVAIDCGSIPGELFESELFGYEQGAFTGARKNGKAGLMEKASTGTLFLDEIGNLPAEMQIKFLRALQEETITRIGGTKPIPIDVRVIAATNANLKEAMEQGLFREDLYYRLNVFTIHVPPLRERAEDIPLLAEHFIRTSNVNNHLVISPAAIKLLMQYHWPGNIRQLSNVIERAIIMSDGKTIQPGDIAQDLGSSMPSEKPEHRFTADLAPLGTLVAEYVSFALKKHQNNISQTAKFLGVSRATIYKHLKHKKTE